ncbi:carbon-nitrogen hydrolase family protein [Nesterenkonia alba]|uniref:carbon-nitrogen hydrolase family protein n=1 Tax=Nesterenkonia alba TaxID=515814 RepID=UPI0003B4E593|nr:carbon-nitrogen hydrolase family protein [Nesterenkonia alba]
MRIAVCQIVTGPDPAANLELMAQWTAEAADAGAQLVVFPEAAQRAFGYPLTEVAENSDEWSTAVHNLGRRHGVVVIAGGFTAGDPAEDGTPRVRNTLLAAGPSVLATYDKLHLYDAFGFTESRTVQPGQRPVHFPLLGMNFGLATCYDIRFPQLFQYYAHQGTHAVVVPASWQAGPGKVAQWRTLAVARALDSTQYVIACGQGLPEAAGVEAPHGAPSGVGHSVIVSPAGEILAEAEEAPEMLIAEIDVETVNATREKLPVLANARTLG